MFKILGHLPYVYIKSGFSDNIFLISPRKHVVGTHNLFSGRNKEDINTFWLKKAP